VEKVPTVADLRARRLELTRAALRETLLEEDDLERFRVVVETLGDEFDVVEVALAAVKLAHEASGAAEDEEEIPDVSFRPERSAGQRPGGRRDERGDRSGGRGGRSSGGRVARLFVGAGRSAGVRPQDLVGAITGETGLNGRDIGSIEIADRFSLVEIPVGVADDVIAGLRGSTIKGRKATVRRDRDGGEGGGERRFDGGDRRERRDFGGERRERDFGGERRRDRH
jgi:ATP-dependent RNA helicase DeaD